jgi:class 3 adenylate cyclase
MGAEGGTTGRLARLWRDERGALELLVGQEQYRADFAHGPAAWTFAVGVVALLATGLVRTSISGFHPLGVGAIALLAVVAAPVVFRWGPKWPVQTLVGLGLLEFPLLIVAVALAGPRVAEAVVVFPAAMSTTWLWFSRRWSILFVALTVVGYGIVVAARPGYPQPVARWLLVAGVVVATNAMLGWVIIRIRRLADEERRVSAEVHRLAVAEGEARAVAEQARSELEAANVELAKWSRTLEQRVSAQVTEIEGLNRLRRFLSPQVAEAVLKSAVSGDDSVLKPHRRRIAVLFCDLRGFTSFASNAEPEEVVEALGAYYDALGELLDAHEATVGSFAGDGVMAYFNDPVPCDDPAGKAVSMAIGMDGPMGALISSWSRRGFDLGYGVGIAYGYATLGTIGFEGRSDYTAVGSVVNLAARLCGEARAGEILVDGRTLEATGVPCERRDVRLKGFPGEVPAFSVLR